MNAWSARSVTNRALLAAGLVAALLAPGLLAAQTQAAPAPPEPAAPVHILPTAEKEKPATPTRGVLPALKSPAAPTTQPTVPSQHLWTQGLSSINTQIKPLPLAPPPDIRNPPAVPGAVDDGTKPYVPPELREKVAPQTNLMLPPLYGWTRIILNKLVMPQDDSVVSSCGMREDLIFSFFAQRMQEGGIPLMSKEQSDKLVPDPVIAVATPVIVSMQDLVINCTSWVQFQVTAEFTFRVPPLMYRRRVPILLWHDGMLVTSAKSTHNGALINAFIELAMRFRHAWDAQQGMVDPSRVLR